MIFKEEYYREVLIEKSTPCSEYNHGDKYWLDKDGDCFRRNNLPTIETQDAFIYTKKNDEVSKIRILYADNWVDNYYGYLNGYLTDEERNTVIWILPDYPPINSSRLFKPPKPPLPIPSH